MCLRTLAKCVVVFLLIGAATKTWAAEQVPVVWGQGMSAAIARLEQSVHSTMMKDAVREAAKSLSSGNSEQRREAVRFFCDLRASGVLEQIMRSGDTMTASAVVDAGGLMAFELSDIPTLFELAMLVPSQPLATGSETLAVRSGIVEQLASRTSLLLQVKHKPLGTDVIDEASSKRAIAAWWKQAVDRASSRDRDGQKLREIQEYFQNRPK